MCPVIPVSSMTARTGAAVLGIALALGALAGCGGSDGDADDGGEPTSSAPESEATDATTDATPETSYLPVPEGVALTAPGTVLGFGDAATVAWRPRQDRVIALDLVVERVDETSFKESFEGWVVTDQMKGQTPYFVHAEATNLSAEDAGGLLVPLYAAGGTNLYQPLTFTKEEFEPCPGGVLPEKLRPGRSAELCFVYLLPEGATFDAAAFELVGELSPITWDGRITSIEKPDKKKKKRDQ